MRMVHFEPNLPQLSNFWPWDKVGDDWVQMGDLIVPYSGLVYPSVEHAYQACKTMDLHARKEICRLPTALDAKKAGRRLTIRPNWDGIKVLVMEELIAIKFSLINPDMVAILLSTGTQEIKEVSPDTTWGTGRDGNGRNEMGRILMEHRSKLAV